MPITIIIRITKLIRCFVHFGRKTYRKKVPINYLEYVLNFVYNRLIYDHISIVYSNLYKCYIYI